MAMNGYDLVSLAIQGTAKRTVWPIHCELGEESIDEVRADQGFKRHLKDFGF